MEESRYGWRVDEGHWEEQEEDNNNTIEKNAGILVCKNVASCYIDVAVIPPTPQQDVVGSHILQPSWQIYKSIISKAHRGYICEFTLIHHNSLQIYSVGISKFDKFNWISISIIYLKLVRKLVHITN